MSNDNIITTHAGHPVPDNQNSKTVGPDGPVLLEDYYLIEKLARFDRERIPERVVHAKGAGAFGYFEVTQDVTDFTHAAFLSRIGQKTEMLARFSTVGGEKGSADSARDPRGFALKFYTEEGNYDLVGNNTPVFFIRDALKFPDFIHSQKRNPATNCKDPDMFWDFLSLSPESTHQVSILFSDRGTPKTYRHMHGYGSHTFKWINAAGQAVWVKYHFKTQSGIENWTNEESIAMAGEDPDYATRDLFETLRNGGEAVWHLFVQIMPLDEAPGYRFNPFDVTKVWSQQDYPLIPVGRMVLNRTPGNYFAEIEQAAFAPANVVPGIGFSPDKMLQGRLFSYPDTHRHRLGGNYELLPVNCPHATRARNYSRNGYMRFDANGGDGPHYEPNSFNGPREAPLYQEAGDVLIGTSGRYKTTQHIEDNDFVQAGNLYRLMDAGAKTRLVHNLVVHLKNARRDIQARQVSHFARADAEFGQRLTEGLGLTGAAQTGTPVMASGE